MALGLTTSPGVTLIDYRKWPNLQHYRFEANALGEDEHGRWLGMPPGTAYTGPRDGAFETASVLLVPHHDWWTALWHPEPEEIEVYVDICHFARWEENRVVIVDLDLDVVRLRDGRVYLDDEDEFEQHRVELAYPQSVADGAVQAARAIIRAVRDRQEPFGAHWTRWLDLVTA